MTERPPAVAGVRIERVADPTEVHRAAILAPLEAFNEAATGDFSPDRSLALLVTDAAGRALGGLWGRGYYRWLFIELLFVPAELRGQGIGSDLLARAEAAALAWGHHGVWLDSFSFQAPAFYRRHGYVDFGTIEDYPDGHARFFLKKRLKGVQYSGALRAA